MESKMIPKEQLNDFIKTLPKKKNNKLIIIKSSK